MNRNLKIIYDARIMTCFVNRSEFLQNLYCLCFKEDYCVLSVFYLFDWSAVCCGGHPKYQFTKSKIHVYYLLSSKVGSFVPALKHFSEIHAELKNLYGEEHPRTLGCREDIANCLRRTKVYTLSGFAPNDKSFLKKCSLYKLS